MGRKRAIKSGDLVEIKASTWGPACISRLEGDKPTGNLFVPTSVVGVWLGVEFINLGIDIVECDTFLYEGSRHVLISGACKKIS